MGPRSTYVFAYKTSKTVANKDNRNITLSKLERPGKSSQEAYSAFSVSEVGQRY